MDSVKVKPRALPGEHDLKMKLRVWLYNPLLGPQKDPKWCLSVPV